MLTIFADLNNKNDLVSSKEEPIPRPDKNEILFKTLACGVCSTDIEYLTNKKLIKKDSKMFNAYIGKKYLGTVGDVGTFSFEVGEDVLSLAVIVYGQATGWYGIDAWTNGDGTSLVTADWPSFEGNERGCVSCANFANQGAGASTTIAPNRPGAEVRPGMHRISVVGWVDGLSTDEVSVRVVAKTGEALPNTGVVDLNFYLTGAQGWTSETVQTDSYFAACIARVNEVYGQIGLSVGEITFHDIDPSFAVISIADGDTGLENLVLN